MILCSKTIHGYTELEYEIYDLIQSLDYLYTEKIDHSSDKAYKEHIRIYKFKFYGRILGSIKYFFNFKFTPLIKAKEFITYDDSNPL